MSILISGMQRATPEFRRCFSQQFRRVSHYSSRKAPNLSTLEATKQAFKDKLPIILFTSMVGTSGFLAYGIHTKRASIAQLEALVKVTQKFTDETEETNRNLKVEGVSQFLRK
jgi:cell division protein FtsL